MKKEVKIGLEIHGYLATKEKLFCECIADRKAEPNSNICPVCCGYPGSKPMLPNIEAVKKVVAIALLLGCKINERVIWQRKHYDWPDLPKGYQDTLSGSFGAPIGVDGNFLGIEIREVHLEEDPAAWDPETGYIDYNRAGLPLVEIVTEPQFGNAKQVREWLQQLVTAVSYIKAFPKDAGIKADVNVSTIGERVEIKNLNSIYNIVKAIDYEIARQLATKSIERETRTYDERKKITITMRTKELEEDYRFIPDPDLPVLCLDKEFVVSIKKSLPELPTQKIERYVKQGINKKEASVLVSDRELAELFEAVLKFGVDAALAAHWITIELLRVLNWNHKQLSEVCINPKHLAELIKLVQEGKLTELKAKQILNSFVPKSFSPSKKLKETEKISEKEIEKLCRKILEENKKAVQDYKAGRKEALDFLIGKVIEASNRRADSKIVKKFFLELLG